MQPSRQTTKVIPLPPALTSNGPAQITVSSQQVGGQPLLGSLIMMTAGFYGDTHFIMNQTSSTFRPRDARDAAAKCGEVAAVQLGVTHIMSWTRTRTVPIADQTFILNDLKKLNPNSVMRTTSN